MFLKIYISGKESPICSKKFENGTQFLDILDFNKCLSNIEQLRILNTFI